MVLDAYGSRCAITGHRIRPTLQAAHIRPVTQQGPHELTNGLLLRSDVHTMFDRGYLSLTDEHRLLVSRSLRQDFGNGRSSTSAPANISCSQASKPTDPAATTWNGTATRCTWQVDPGILGTCRNATCWARNWNHAAPIR